jgi:hypothetical protein
VLTTDEDKQPVVARDNNFVLAATKAGSPVQGCIYINRKDRFADGTVDYADVELVKKELHSFLRDELSTSFGSGFHLWTAAQDSIFGPDMMVSIAGVDIHNSSFSPIVDRNSRPRSIHVPEGFVWLSGGGPVVEMLKPVEVNAQLSSIRYNHQITP